MRYSNFPIAAVCAIFTSGFVFNGHALSAPESPKVTEAATTKRDIRWGELDNSGLQMGVWQNPKSLMAFCLIRNAGTQNVRFSDYYFDWADPNGVSLLARPTGQNADWTKLGGSRLYMNISRGLGPTEKNRITLLPGRKYLTRLYHSEMKSTRPIDFEQSSRWISLSHYIWPAEWKGTVEWKIEQEITNRHENPKDLWTGTLVSGVLQNDVDEIRRRQLQAFESTLKYQEEIDAQTQDKSEFTQRRKEHLKSFIEVLKAEQEKGATKDAAP